MVAHTCRRFVRFSIAGDKVPERDWLGAPLQREKEKVRKEKRLPMIGEGDEYAQNNKEDP